MKTISKKLTVFIVLLSMVLTLLPAAVFADGNDGGSEESGAFVSAAGGEDTIIDLDIGGNGTAEVIGDGYESSVIDNITEYKIPAGTEEISVKLTPGENAALVRVVIAAGEGDEEQYFNYDVYSEEEYTFNYKLDPSVNKYVFIADFFDKDWENHLGFENYDPNSDRLKVEYKLDDNDWAVLGEGQNSIVIPLSAGTAHIRLTASGDYKDSFRGVNYWNATAPESETQFAVAENGVCEFSVNGFLPPVTVRIIDKENNMPLPGDYIVWYDEEEASVRVNNETVYDNEDRDYAPGTELSFSLEPPMGVEKPYKVEMKYNRTNEAVDLTDNVDYNVFSITPENNNGFYVKIYWTEEQYIFDNFEPVWWEDECMLEVEMPMSPGDVKAEAGGTELKSAAYGNRIKFIVPAGTANVDLICTPYGEDVLSTIIADNEEPLELNEKGEYTYSLAVDLSQSNWYHVVVEFRYDGPLWMNLLNYDPEDPSVEISYRFNDAAQWTAIEEGASRIYFTDDAEKMELRIIAKDGFKDSFGGINYYIWTAPPEEMMHQGAEDGTCLFTLDFFDIGGELEILTEEALPFTDVPEDSFYYDAVKWALKNNITTGTSANEFSPDNYCLRGQAVTFLWRAADFPEPSVTECPFTDVEEGLFYYEPVLWASGKHITTGTSETLFSPDNYCLRGQIVTFLWRLADHPEPEMQTCPFTDVDENEYYYKPVLWAFENGITTGTSDTEFSPNNICLRSQVVTFLYRMFKNS